MEVNAADSYGTSSAWNFRFIDISQKTVIAIIKISNPCKVALQFQAVHTCLASNPSYCTNLSFQLRLYGMNQLHWLSSFCMSCVDYHTVLIHRTVWNCSLQTYRKREFLLDSVFFIIFWFWTGGTVNYR